VLTVDYRFALSNPALVSAALVAFIQSFGDVRTTEETIGLIKQGKWSASTSIREAARAEA
jgi:hypothetical protein